MSVAGGDGRSGGPAQERPLGLASTTRDIRMVTDETDQSDDCGENGYRTAFTMI